MSDEHTGLANGMEPPSQRFDSSLFGPSAYGDRSRCVLPDILEHRYQHLGVVDTVLNKLRTVMVLVEVAMSRLGSLKEGSNIRIVGLLAKLFGHLRKAVVCAVVPAAVYGDGRELVGHCPPCLL